MFFTYTHSSVVKGVRSLYGSCFGHSGQAEIIIFGHSGIIDSGQETSGGSGHLFSEAGRGTGLSTDAGVVFDFKTCSLFDVSAVVDSDCTKGFDILTF